MRQLLFSLFDKLDKLSSVFGGRTIALLVISLLIAMMTIFFSDNWMQSIKEKNVEISKLRNVVFELNQLQINMLKAESAQRGYLLTNSEEYALPYTNVLADARKNIEAAKMVLQSMGPTEQYQEENNLLDKIAASIEVKAAELDVTLELARKGEDSSAKKIIKLDDGLAEMQSITTNSAALIENFNKRYSDAFNDLDATRTLARVAVITGPLVLIFLVVLVIKQLLKELADKALLQEALADENKKYELKSLEQGKLLISLALDYQSDVERERQKLAREIHDELGSILTATKMDISWVIKYLKTEYPDITEKLKKTNRYLDQGINFKRQIVQELHPSMIATFGFWPALKTLIEDATERSKWKLNLILPDENTKIDETISLVAYRVVQETINNTIKYAQATELSVHIINDEKNLKIEIQDNGVGVDLDKLEKTTHGLSGMRHRILAIGGHFEMVSSIGNGVFTRAILPLDIKPTL